MRGYFGIGIYMPKTSENIGTLWRSAMNFGASFMFSIGTRAMIRQPSDTILSFRHIPFYVYPDWDSFQQPTDCFLIGVEQCEKSVPIKTFEHPQRACYILGSEDGGLPAKVIEYCTGGIIQIATPMCLNVAVAGSIVMFDRLNKANV
jgi:tRNA(Leu) C34 or U34 (ribose-2'-O)-methylase TrmL